MTEQRFIAELRLPKEMEVTSIRLTDKQRADLNASIIEQDKNTVDFHYNNRERAIMSVAFLDQKVNARNGALAGVAAIGGSWFAMNSAKFLTGKGLLLRAPLCMFIGGAAYWAWTESAFRNYTFTAKKVNQRINNELNKMMDLE